MINSRSQAWGLTPITSILWRLRQKDQEFRPVFGYECKNPSQKTRTKIKSRKGKKFYINLDIRSIKPLNYSK